VLKPDARKRATEKNKMHFFTSFSLVGI